ncbi:MAG: FAD-dependent monooxygenase, partial [Gammaproteobacteria bacterium]|nr:FAD-dependent monooxygenase [Gammaproteobacteria bacterium]
MRLTDTEVLVIGAGPAGTFAAIRLASLGWQVTLVEQSRYPRQKVCGECLGPASLELLDEIGLGADVRRLAGPSIRQVGWAAADRTIVAEMPACAGSRYPHGCAIGRDILDSLLLERARSQGVDILQPVRVRRISGVPGNLACVCEWRDDPLTHQRAHRCEVVRAALVIDAHGSWERSFDGAIAAQGAHEEGAPRASDLLAFKASFAGAALAPGVLPVLCLPGGYGGMVVSDRGRTTVAGCIRRETLRQWRARARGGSAGEVVETYLR